MMKRLIKTILDNKRKNDNNMQKVMVKNTNKVNLNEIINYLVKEPEFIQEKDNVKKKLKKLINNWNKFELTVLMNQIRKEELNESVSNLNKKRELAASVKLC